MELVECDLGLGQVVGDALDEGSTHVDAHLLDVGGIAVVGFEIVGELTHRVGATAFRDEQDTTLIDVDEQGRAYNLDETIQRMRYRDGYDKPLAWMQPGKVYKVKLQPMTTSNYFAPGHRLRIEISSSNFPRFDRNMNTGGNNYDETKGVIANNAVHHSKQHPSEVTITVIKKRK